MEDPLEILFDELYAQGKTWDEAVEIAAGVEDPEDQLDLTEWLIFHRGASRREMLTEKHRLMRRRMEMEEE